MTTNLFFFFWIFALTNKPTIWLLIYCHWARWRPLAGALSDQSKTRPVSLVLHESEFVFCPVWSVTPVKISLSFAVCLGFLCYC